MITTHPFVHKADAPLRAQGGRLMESTIGDPPCAVEDCGAKWSSHAFKTPTEFQAGMMQLITAVPAPGALDLPPMQRPIIIMPEQAQVVTDGQRRIALPATEPHYYVWLLLQHYPQENPNIRGVAPTKNEAMDLVPHEWRGGKMWIPSAHQFGDVNAVDTNDCYLLLTIGSSMPDWYVQRYELNVLEDAR